MKTFRHSFTVHASLETVAEFHSRSSSMAAITPPPVRVQVHQAPDRLSEGDEMRFTLWLGPLPVRWLARMEGVSPLGFVDRQIRGPFREWVHQHRFLPLNEGATQVLDEVHLRIRLHPLWGLIGLLMRMSLPFLFWYRGWKTRRLLNGC